MKSDRAFARMLAYAAVLLLLQWPTIMQVGSHYVQKKAIQKQVKKIMMKNIPKEALVFFQFSKNDREEKLFWKHDREFLYLGEMYDVVYRETTLDSVFYWCWWDKEETALYQKMKEVVRYSPDHLPGKKDAERKWFEFQKNVYCIEIENISCSRSCLDGVKIFFDKNLYTSAMFLPASPPPEFG